MNHKFIFELEIIICHIIFIVIFVMIMSKFFILINNGASDIEISIKKPYQYL